MTLEAGVDEMKGAAKLEEDGDVAGGFGGGEAVGEEIGVEGVAFGEGERVVGGGFLGVNVAVEGGESAMEKVEEEGDGEGMEVVGCVVLKADFALGVGEGLELGVEFVEELVEEGIGGERSGEAEGGGVGEETGIAEGVFESGMSDLEEEGAERGGEVFHGGRIPTKNVG